ncbi:S8 family serine peptidase [Virgibacillus necropolis]|uniref:S8 family serine peptidase n=1 Tax=Virgibacillus necropolis TaxID=163877 RepID=UPI00384F0C61
MVEVATSWVIAGMYIINLSLGSINNTQIAADAFAINNAMLSGVVSVVATGNSGPKRSTIRTPTTASMAILLGIQQTLKHCGRQIYV